MPTLGTSGSPTAGDGGDDVVRVFMSYRRTDDANFTGRFHDKLINVFGDANVFRDIDSIPAGTRFEDVINARLSDVDAVLALIGPTWGARIDSAADFVRMEIAHALQSGTPVIPVLIEDTPLPTSDGLPDDLKPMLDRQTVRVRRDPDFHRDAARVIDGVRDAVIAQREREAAARRVAEAAAQAEREEEERRQAELAHRRELEAELARADAKAEEERRAAEALAAERAQRLAQLARLEEEATQRRIADERARVAEIVESQQAREREAEAAAARAEALRRELGGGPPAGPDETVDDRFPAVADLIEPGAAMTVDEPVAAEPSRVEEPAPVERPEPTVAGRRTFASASRAEVIGGVLLLVATAFALQALFDKADYTNAFDEGGWSTDILAVVLTAALLLPFLAFFYGINVPAVTAGTAVGWIAYQGLVDSYVFTGYWGADDTKFPTNIVIIAVLLGAAWYMFRRGNPLPRTAVEHPPSRYLQIAAAAGTFVTVGLYVKQRIDWDSAGAVLFALAAVALFMLVLSLRRGLEATTLLATLAAESALAYLMYAIDDEDYRSKLLNVSIAAAVLTGAALGRTRRATAPTGV